MSVVRSAATLAAAFAVAGCAALPAERSYRASAELVEQRLGTAPIWPAEAVPAAAAPAPASAAEAVRLAFTHHPQIRALQARIGTGRADFEEARRLPNPTFGISRLSPREDGGAQTTRSVSLGLGDLLLLPSRTRLAGGELARVEQTVAAELIDLAIDVEIAWYTAIGAAQIAAMRDLVAVAAEQSAALAQRFYAAGNIDRLQLEQERASAAHARIEAVRAAAEAARARLALAAATGVHGVDWTLTTQLPAPLSASPDADALGAAALEQRLDLAVAERAVALRRDALRLVRRWRWFGDIEIGYERERDGDGSVLRGPSLSFALPLFDQGQAELERAQAELLAAQAEFDALAATVRNEARLGVDAVNAARDIAERYRTILVPGREAIVARMQERVNYMLVGVFELIVARREEFDAYQEYLEAVRDYWIARAELRRAVGGALPDDAAQPDATLGIDAVLPPAAPVDHSQHHDPHAGHRRGDAAEQQQEQQQQQQQQHEHHGDHR